MAQQALDSFTMEVDGAPVTVGKGEVLPEGHPVLKQLGGDVGNLFRPLLEDKPPAAAKTVRSRAGG